MSLPGCALASAIEFSHVVGGNVAGDDQHFRHRHVERDRCNIPGDVVGDFFHEGVDDERARAHDPDGVAVGIGFCDRVGPQHAGLSAAIFDHDRLFGQFRHALADHARDDVVRPAGRERHDQLDRLGRKILRRNEPASAAATMRPPAPPESSSKLPAQMSLRLSRFNLVQQNSRTCCVIRADQISNSSVCASLTGFWLIRSLQTQ